MDPSLIEGFFSLMGQAVTKRKPNVSVELPTVESLRADLFGEETSAAPEEEVHRAPSEIAQSSRRAQAIATGCVPCSIGHLGTCSGLLNEAMRFARAEGIASEEVITRCNMCLDELNAMERVDLRPELINGLPGWEKDLALEALNLSRSLRHELEGLSSVDGLEGITAKAQGTRQQIGSAWFRERLARLNPEQRKAVEQRLHESLTLDQAKKAAAAEAAKEVERQWDSQEKT